jgi:hypothetical protein
MQSATDRDTYVEIVWDNIQPGTENNFNTYPATRISTFGVEYDYESVMHYGATAFSINGQRTIIPIFVSTLLWNACSTVINFIISFYRIQKRIWDNAHI